MTPSWLPVRRAFVFPLFLFLMALPRESAAQTGTSPGALTGYSTIYSIGVEWDITGDSDHDARAAVEYRVAAGGDWKPAMPLVRIDYNGRNMLAGSLFYLTPDTDYVVRISLVDPDGGGDSRELSVRTRPIPALPSGGRLLHVVPGNGGGDGSAGSPFGGVAAAQAVAQPGDILFLHGGYYGGRIVFTKGGSPSRYIVWKAAGDGEVTMTGIDILASHLWFEGITVRDQQYGTRTENAPTNIVLTRSFFFNNHYSVFLSGGGSNWYIADNTIVGSTPAWSGNDEGEGIELNTTNGHTVAHNSITNVADGVSYPRMNVDIFGNDIFDTADDGVELDFGLANVRVWGNRIHNAVHNGVSFQPQSGGPWYIIRNQIAGNAEAPLKFRTTDHFVLLQNTIVNWGGWMFCCQSNDILKAYARNNLWISAQGGQMWGVQSSAMDWRTDLDYEGFDWGTGPYPFWYDGNVYYDVGSFANASGLVPHGIRIFKDSCFQDFRVTAPPPTPIPAHVMSLQPSCNAVDAGAVLPNINDGYAGAAPDLGAHEYGLAAAMYGPRAEEATPPASPPGPSIPPSSVPGSWLGGDVGAVAAAGSAVESNGVWTLWGSGSDVWGSADEFMFAYRELSGDGSIVARVASAENTSSWAKAGVMMRASLDASSAHGFVFVTPGGANGVAFQRRAAAGGSTAHTSGGAGAPPVWLKLTRSGQTITASKSQDGAAWTAIGTDTLAMGATIYVGLAFTSHADGVIGTATFDGVTVSSAGAPASEPPSGWQHRDIGSVGVAGDATNTGGAWVLRASGADIWGAADAFHYAYRVLDADGSIVARVSGVANTNAWAKAGVMMRASLSAGSPHAFMFVTPDGANGLAFQRRLTSGGATAHSAGGAGSPPVWVRLTRTGSTVTASRSIDGVNWIDVGRDTIGTAGPVYVGLAATSHDNQSLGLAAFDNVAVQTGSDAWAHTDIGAVAAGGDAWIDGAAATVTGSGADIWGTGDEFHYLARIASGDFAIAARVTSIDAVDVWTKAGLMIRAAATPSSAHASLFATPSSVKGVAFQRRAAQGAGSVHTAGPAAAPAIWLRLTRTGGAVSAAFRLNEGDAWTTFASETATGLPDTVLVGFAVTSHQDGALATATFDHVSISVNP